MMRAGKSARWLSNQAPRLFALLARRPRALHGAHRVLVNPSPLFLARSYRSRSSPSAAGSSLVMVQTLLAMPLSRPTAADGSTWLDRELLADDPALVAPCRASVAR